MVILLPVPLTGSNSMSGEDVRRTFVTEFLDRPDANTDDQLIY